jgi:tetratricopeptide (TPR) repeat protein
VNRLHALLAVDQSWKNHAQVLPLEPFAEKFGQLYLLKKQEHLGFTIDPVLGQNLLLLAQGRPILIDLAADWLAREIPLEWLRDKNTDKLKEELSGPDKEQKILEFQNRLVQYIGQGRRELDWLFLIMAHIFPLDIPLIQALRKLNLESAEKLFSEAQTYTFVKRLPDGRIKLHDVMQEMINEFVWKELDDEKERRRRDSQLALNFYAERLKKIEDEINQSATANKEKFIEREKLYRELYILHGSHLNHLFYTDLSKGVREFKQLFEQATLFARLSSRKNLLDATTAYLSELTFDDKYHVNTRWVRYWLDEGQIEQARAILDQLFAYPTLTPEQLLGLHTNEANYFIKAHKLPDAIRSLEKANESCEQNPGELGNYRGTVLNTLGWVYRQMGNHTLAAEYYDHALGATLDPLKVASILNNAGYVHSFDGLYDKAIEYCQEALAMRETGKDIQGQGKSYSTIGDVYRNMGNYQKSLEAYNKAFEIFEPEHVRPWLAYIYSHRGAVLRLLKRPEEARKDILASIHLNVQKELPWAYHVLGCLYWDEMNWSDALKYFDKSDQYAIDIGDMHTQVNNMVGSAEIFYQKWAESGWKNDSQTELILKKAATLQDVIQQGYEFPHHQGRMLRVLADTAFRQNRHEEALHYYAEAYSLLGRRSAGYGPTTFRDEFDRVEKNIMYLAQGEKQPAVALHWCKYIKEYLASKPDILQASALIGKCTLLETKIRLKVVVSPTGA